MHVLLPAKHPEFNSLIKDLLSHRTIKVNPSEQKYVVKDFATRVINGVGGSWSRAGLPDPNSLGTDDMSIINYLAQGLYLYGEGWT